MPMGSPFGGGGGSGQSANVFAPPGQQQVALEMGQILGPLANLSMNAGAGTPAGQNYPTAQNFVSQYFTGSPFIPQAMNTAGQAYQDYSNLVYPGVMGDLGSMFNAAGYGLNSASPLLGQAMDPGFTQAIQNLQSSPYLAQQLANAQNLAGAGNAIMQAGFDPQGQLFQQMQQQLMDRSNALAAMSGLSGSPYASSMTANALGNQALQWNAQQQAREQQAAAAASPLLMAPGNVYTQQQNAILQALADRTRAGVEGAAGYGSLMGSAGGALQGAQNLGSGAAQTLASLGALPYQTGAGIGSNALNSLMNLTNLGNNQFLLPQQVIGDAMQYLGLGQNASQIAGSLQAQNFNQLSSGIGGALSGANALFGGNGLFSSGGALGGLGGAAGGFDSFGFPLAGVATDAGTGLAQAATGGGLLSGLGSVLPFSGP